MILYTERLLKIIRTPHLSEKSSIVSEKYGTVVLYVAKYATKSDIKNVMYSVFSVKLKKINILITSKKRKGSRKNVGYRCSWKKAYVVLKPGYKLDFVNMIK